MFVNENWKLWLYSSRLYEWLIDNIVLNFRTPIFHILGRNPHPDIFFDSTEEEPTPLFQAGEIHEFEPTVNDIESILDNYLHSKISETIWWLHWIATNEFRWIHIIVILFMSFPNEKLLSLYVLKYIYLSSSVYTISLFFRHDPHTDEANYLPIWTLSLTSVISWLALGLKVLHIIKQTREHYGQKFGALLYITSWCKYQCINEH